jgi:hypothetical protein
VLDWAAARHYRREHEPQLWEQMSRSLPSSKDVKKAQHVSLPRHFQRHRGDPLIWSRGGSQGRAGIFDPD